MADFQILRQKFATLKIFEMPIMHTLRYTRTKVYINCSVCLNLQLKTYIVNSNTTFPQF
jgi:hypothetical protein